MKRVCPLEAEKQVTHADSVITEIYCVVVRGASLETRKFLLMYKIPGRLNYSFAWIYA